MLNTKTMNLSLFRTLVIVGQSKDLKEAAAKLGMDSSNVSRNIKSLENIMNIKIINRGVKNYIQLTDDGKKLFEGYEKAYNILCITEKELIQSKNLDTGKISIGVSNDIEIDILSEKIKNFKEKYPNVTFKIVNLPTEELYKNLSQYYLDFIIDEKNDNLTKSSEIEFKEFKKDDYCIISLDNNEIDLSNKEQISKLPLIVCRKDRNLLNEIFKERKLNISIEVSNYNSAIKYVESGLGYAIVPKRVIKDKNIFYKSLGISKLIGLSYIKENLSPSVKEFFKIFFGGLEN